MPPLTIFNIAICTNTFDTVDFVVVVLSINLKHNKSVGHANNEKKSICAVQLIEMQFVAFVPKNAMQRVLKYARVYGVALDGVLEYIWFYAYIVSDWR